MLDDIQRRLDELSHALLEELERATDLSLGVSQECEKASNELASLSTDLATLLGEDAEQPHEDEWYVIVSHRLSTGCLEVLNMGQSIRSGVEALMLEPTEFGSTIENVLDIEKQLRLRLQELLRDAGELASSQIDSLGFKTQISGLRESLHRADVLCPRIGDMGDRLMSIMQTLSASEQCLDQTSSRMDVEGKQMALGNTSSDSRPAGVLSEGKEGQGRQRPEATHREIRVLYCTRCGTPLRSGASFCSHCGAQVEHIEVPGGMLAPGASTPMPAEQCSQPPIPALQYSQPASSAGKGRGLFAEPARKLAAALRRRKLVAALRRHDGQQAGGDGQKAPKSDRPIIGSYSPVMPQAEVNVNGTGKSSWADGTLIVTSREQSNLKDNREVPAPKVSDVQFAAISPRTAARSSYCAVDIVMYEDGWEKAVKGVAEEHDEPTRIVTSGWLEAYEGIHVRIDLSSPELGVIGVREERWCGRYLRFDFAFKIPPEFKDDEVLMNANVFFDDVPATHLSFVVGIGGYGAGVSKVDRRDVSSAFLSYASKDRGRVAVIAQGIEAVRPDLDVFLDVENLRSGDDWQKVLDDEIKRRDVLFLCWSRAASESEWVDYEWRCAYDHKGIDGIEPVAIDSPDVCPPPEELKSKHFNSRLLYIANVGKESV